MYNPLSNIFWAIVIVAWVCGLAFFLGKLATLLKELTSVIKHVYCNYRSRLFPPYLVFAACITCILVSLAAGGLIYLYVTIPLNHFVETTAGMELFQELDAYPERRTLIFFTYCMIHIMYFYLAVLKTVMDDIWTVIDAITKPPVRNWKDVVCSVIMVITLILTLVIASLFVLSGIFAVSKV